MSRHPIPRPAPAPAPARPGRRKATRLLVGAAVLAAAGAGGWYALRAWDRSAERSAALELAKGGKAADAVPALRRCLDRDPDDAEVLQTLVTATRKSGGSPGEIEPLLDRLCELRSSDPAPFRDRMDLRRRYGRPAEALADGARAVELAPDDDATRLTVARLALDQGKYDAAEKHLTRLLDKPTRAASRPELGFYLARLYWERGDVARAGEALARYVPRDEDYPPARILRGILAYESDRFEETLAIFRGVDPRDRTSRTIALYYTALALGRLGREGEARKALDELNEAQALARAAIDAKMRLHDMPSQVRAARAWLATGQPREAAGVLEDAVKRLGDDRDAWTVLAECYDKLGRPDLADTAKRKAGGGR